MHARQSSVAKFSEQNGAILRAGMPEALNFEIERDQSPLLSSLSARELRNLLTSYPIEHHGNIFLPQAYQNQTWADRAWRYLIRMSPHEPSATPRSPECHGFMATPVKLVLDFTLEMRWHRDDTFLDVGCGKGEMALLTGKLVRIPVEGFDCNREFIKMARRSADNIPDIKAHFVHCNEDQADLSRATVIFMFYPFRGQTHDYFMRRIKAQSYDRPLVICSLGETTNCLEELDWLTKVNEAVDWERIAIFTTDPKAYMVRAQSKSF